MSWWDLFCYFQSKKSQFDIFLSVVLEEKMSDYHSSFCFFLFKASEIDEFLQNFFASNWF